MSEFFPCGCSKVFSPDKVSLNCPLIWGLYHQGATFALFQLETPLGQNFSRQHKPNNIPELADLTSIIRPGSLDTIIDGETVTKKFIKRKHGEEEVEHFHPSVEKILGNTYGFITFQEQAIQIGKELAGFSGVEADAYLRKGIGKKKADLIAIAKKLFIKGCKEKGIVDNKTAKEIFEGIESAGRYSFNLSHAISYALNSFIFSGYSKAHFPIEFYMAELESAEDRDKTRLILDDALKMGINILPPNLLTLNPNSVKIKKGKSSFNIGYGLSKLKYVSENCINQIKKNIKTFNLNSNNITDIEIICGLLFSIKKDSVDSLVLSGALDFTKIPRFELMYKYLVIHGFVGGRLPEAKTRLNSYFLQNKGLTISQVFAKMMEEGTGKGKLLGNKVSLDKARRFKYKIDNPSRNLQNNTRRLSKGERDYIGREMTVTEVDQYYSGYSSEDIREGVPQKGISIPAIISYVKHKTDKNGSPMMTVQAYDKWGTLFGLIFKDNVEDVDYSVFSKNKVILKGDISDNGLFLIRKAIQL